MKRFFRLFLAMAIVVCNFAPVFADDAADEQANLVMRYDFESENVTTEDNKTYTIKDVSGNGYDAVSTEPLNVYFPDFDLADSRCGSGKAAVGAVRFPNEAFYNIDTSYTINFLGEYMWGRDILLRLGDNYYTTAYGSGMCRISSYFGSNGRIVDFNEYFPHNDVNMFTFVRDGDVFEMYFNGVKMSIMREYGESSGTISEMALDPEKVFMLQNTYIDEFSLYDGPLDAEQIGELYNALVPIQSTPEPPCYEVVTVPAPTVSVESGAVPSGQLVTIENNSGIGTLMYSYGDGRWIAADSPLKLIIGDEFSLSVKVNVDSPEPNKEYICEEATYTYTMDFSTEVAPNEYEEKYNVSYHSGGIGNEYTGEKVPPYGNKISSVEELSSLYIRRPEYLEEMEEKYDEEFFKENFLVVVLWEQSHGARDRYLEKVEIDENDVNIVMGEALYCGNSTQAFRWFCAVLEMPISEDNKALALDGKTFFVPPLCIEPAAEYTVTFNTSSYVQVYTDATRTEYAQSPYTTTNGELYFDLYMIPGGGALVDIITTSGYLECDGYHYVLKGVTEDAVIKDSYYTGPYFGVDVERNEDNSVTVDVNASYATAIAPSGKIIFAAYADDGALYSVETCDMEYGNNTFTLADVPENVKTFKAMWWDSMSDMKPVIGAEKCILE